MLAKTADHIEGQDIPFGVGCPEVTDHRFAHGSPLSAEGPEPFGVLMVLRKIEGFIEGFTDNRSLITGFFGAGRSAPTIPCLSSDPDAP
jgi:hypothetical protein